MSWNQTDTSFKILNNKRATDSGKLILNEKGDFTLNVHASEIWLDAIPGTPPSATTSVVQVYSQLALLQDTSVPNGASCFATTNTDIVAGQNDESSRLKSWISDKFNGGTGTYSATVYDGSNRLLSVADPSGYYFNYQTGVLTFQNANTAYGSVASTGPFKVTGYRYVGRRGVGNGTVTSVASGAGLSGGPITASGTLAVDQSYAFAWTGPQSFAADSLMTGNLVFTPSAGKFGLRAANLASLPTADASTVGGIVWDAASGDLKVSNGSAWLRLATTAAGATNVTGSGTTHTLALWENATGLLGDSIITQSGTTVQVAGTITAQTKSFTIDHPTKRGKLLIYGSLEGPEHGAYHRGRARGEGEVRVELPEYWHALAGADYTVQITAYGNYEIHVCAQDKNGFTVKRSGWWPFRKKSLEFTYFAVGSRRDAPLVTEQDIQPVLD